MSIKKIKVKDLKENMYVRDNNIITKVQFICSCEECNKRGFQEVVLNNGDCLTISMKEKEVKASYNIIDLIEVGDLVNGMMVEDITEDRLYCNLCDECGTYQASIPNENIMSILTKEQIEAHSYKVGE